MYIIPLSVLSLASAAPSMRLLTPGEFHADEVQLQDGDRWMGLFSTTSGWELRMERLRVEPFYDPLVDHDGEATGRRVEVPGSPLVMMNGIERLQPGPVKSVAVPATLAPGQQVAVRIDAGPELVLAATGTPGREGTPESALIRDYRLSAAVEAANQALVNQPVPTAWLPRMLWAGDLDRDGRVDLLMDVSTTYSSRKLVLFLSSSNLAGQVFGAVAGFVTSGC